MYKMVSSNLKSIIKRVVGKNMIVIKNTNFSDLFYSQSIYEDTNGKVSYKCNILVESKSGLIKEIAYKLSHNYDPNLVLLMATIECDYRNGNKPISLDVVDLSSVNQNYQCDTFFQVLEQTCRNFSSCF
ncbi:hypothetical protein DID75_04720 [Candidatus Marinamargulisbacteria bacterium SCGC AG-410-N11]|nr:hypothetical protein DID75_04720 [Candidatus Marinamargulisbacteria bacterium SCGC AG-410-N11]